MFFPRWVHFLQTYKTASEPIWIEKWPLHWTCLSCLSTGPPSSSTPLAVWVRWKAAAGPSREAKATKGPSRILACRLHLRWLRVSPGFLPPSLHRSSRQHQHNRQSAFSQHPGAGGSLPTRCSLKMTAQMSHILSEVRKEKKKEKKKKYIIIYLYIYCLSVTAGVVEDGQRVRGRKRRRLYKSDSEGFSSPLLHVNAGRRPLDQKPFPVGIRTIGSFHGAMTNSRLNPHLLHATTSSAPVHKRDVQMVHRVQGMTQGSISTFRQQKAIRGCLMAPRGRRRAHSSPAFSPLVVGGENYSLASPSVRVCTEDRGRVQFNRFQRIPG